MSPSGALLAHLVPATSARQLWRVEGRHRARFLHAMTTAEFQKRVPGDCGFACVMTANGKHAGQLRFEVETNTILLGGDATGMESVFQVLAKHRVADDVRWHLDPLGDTTSTVALVGTGDGTDLAALVTTLLGEAPAAGTWLDLAWQGAPVRVSAWRAAESELARPTCLVRIACAAAQAFLDAARQGGADPTDAILWDLLRIQAGWPRDGVDLAGDESTIASERLVATISETKGCFLGQEVFVMARDLGQTPRRLVGIEFASEEREALARDAFETMNPTPTSTALVNADGTPVGRIGSRQGTRGLAIVKRKLAIPETVLSVEGGGIARVVPFAIT